MGVPATVLTRMLALHRIGLIQKGQAMLELGEQNLNCAGQSAVTRMFTSTVSGGDFSDDARFEALSNQGLAGDLFELAGFTVTSLDIFPGKRTAVMDLNFATPPQEFKGRFDVVTNFGTTEHIFNQYNAFQFIHECTRVGGLMIHQLPMGGWRDHCLVQYNPKFFLLLALANDYTLIDFRINVGAPDGSDVSYWESLQANILGAKSGAVAPEPAKGSFFVLQKTFDHPFQPAVDKTSGPLNAEEIKPLRRF